MSQSSSLEALLGLSSPPVAITFTDTPPPGIARIAQREPAGCGYWRRAAGGDVFYTTPMTTSSASSGRTRTTCRSRKRRNRN